MTLAEFLVTVVVSGGTTLVVSVARFRVSERRYFRRQLDTLDAIQRSYASMLSAAVKRNEPPF